MQFFTIAIVLRNTKLHCLIPIPMKTLLLLCCTAWTLSINAQCPCCKDSSFRALDFWIGQWEVFDQQNRLAGTSSITKILDNCAVLEEWTSNNTQQGFRYAGKSFNYYQPHSGSWQQLWIDNTGKQIHYTLGKKQAGMLELFTLPQKINKDTTFLRRLRLHLNPDATVVQQGAISTNNGQSWNTEYLLTYRKKPQVTTKDSIEKRCQQFVAYFRSNNMALMATLYHNDACIVGDGYKGCGKEEILKYWEELKDKGISWDLVVEHTQVDGDQAIQTGISDLTFLLDGKPYQSKTRFVLIWRQIPGEGWKVSLDQYAKY